ncbi:MAG: cytosine permease [Thermaerobacter sp.]|nr:cytosine permease [Thermaerobacter sp.]
MSVWKTETHSVEPIPLSERHGNPRDLFTLWFSANMQVTTIALGAVYVFIGLPLVWSIIAIILGNLIGAVFMAYHSAQGPIIGVPQMIQSRAQFGYYGALLPLALAVIMYLGFFALSSVLGGQSLTSLVGMHASTGSVTIGIVLLGIVTALMAVFGYDLIHAYQRYVSLVFLVAFVVFTVAVAVSGQVPHSVWGFSGFSLADFVAGVTLAVTWQITYAPYVSDYSRYLPKEAGVSSTFNMTFWGTVIASVWMMIIGAVLTEISSKLSTPDMINSIAGGLGWLMMIIILLGIVAANVLNVYGGMLTTDTVFGTFTKGRPSTGRRLTMIALFAVVGIIVAIIAEGNFNSSLNNFIVFLTYFAVPWTAINLTDFYLVRRGQYDPEAFLRPAGYGKANWLALLAFVIGVLVEIPFIDSSLYEGPFAKAMGGADISWIFGLIFAGGIYLWTARSRASVSRSMSA